MLCILYSVLPNDIILQNYNFKNFNQDIDIDMIYQLYSDFLGLTLICVYVSLCVFNFKNFIFGGHTAEAHVIS